MRLPRDMNIVSPSGNLIKYGLAPHPYGRDNGLILFGELFAIFHGQAVFLFQLSH